jgi:hypothetical protein
MITVQVTQRHIDKGEKNDCNYCPVGIAMRESTGCYVVVTQQAAAFTHDKYGTFAEKMPKSVERFIERYDRGESVKPFQFRLKSFKAKPKENQ